MDDFFSLPYLIEWSSQEEDCVVSNRILGIHILRQPTTAMFSFGGKLYERVGTDGDSNDMRTCLWPLRTCWAWSLGSNWSPMFLQSQRVAKLQEEYGNMESKPLRVKKYFWMTTWSCWMYVFRMEKSSRQSAIWQGETCMHLWTLCLHTSGL